MKTKNKKIIKITNIIRPVVEDPTIVRNKIKQDLLKELKPLLDRPQQQQPNIPLSKLQEHSELILKIQQLQTLNLKDIAFLKSEVSKNASAIVRLTNVFGKTRAELEDKILKSSKTKPQPLKQPELNIKGIINKILGLIPKPQPQKPVIIHHQKPTVIIKNITTNIVRDNPIYDEKLTVLSNRIILINNWIKQQEKLRDTNKREFGKLRRQVRANTMSTTSLGLLTMSMSATIAGITATLATITNTINNLKNGAKGALKSVKAFAKRIPIVGAAIESTDAIFDNDVRKRLNLAPNEKITAKHRAEVAFKSGISGAVGVIGDTAGLVAKGIGWATNSKTISDFGTTLENSIGSEGIKNIVYKVTESAKAEIKKDKPQDYKKPEPVVLPPKENPTTNKTIINEVPTEIQMPDFNIINIDNSEVIQGVQDNPTIDFTATPTYLEQELHKLHV